MRFLVPTWLHVGFKNPPKTRLGAPLEALGRSWRRLGASWRRLGASWARLGASWAVKATSYAEGEGSAMHAPSRGADFPTP